MAIPSIPSNFFVQSGNNQVLLSWDIVAGATSYAVQRSTDGVTFSSLGTPAVNSYLDTAVTASTQYFYQVASVNGSGTSSYTQAQSATPTLTGELSLGQIRLAAQQRADMVNSQFIQTPEWNSYINQSYFELYDILTTAFEDYYMAEPLVFQTDGTSTLYDLPNGVNYSGARPFYKLLGVDYGVAGNTNAWVSLSKFNFIGRNRYIYPQLTSTALGPFNLQYRVLGSQLMFIPTATAAQYIRLWYIPRMEQLLQDTDVVDGVSGWTEYIIVDAAIKAMQKEESDCTILMAQKQALLDRIQSTASNRDAGQPDTISDVRSYSERWGGYGSPNGDGSFGGF